MAQAHETVARVRVGHFVAGAPKVDISLGKMSVLKEVESRSISGFQEIEAGTYSLSISTNGDAAAKPIINPQDVTLAADHNYSLALVGDGAKGDLQMLVIDETAAAEACGMSNHVLRIIVNNVVGLEAGLSFYESKMWLEQGLQFGTYSASCYAPFKWDTGKAVAGDDLDAILFDFDNQEDGAGGFWEPYTVYFYGVMGNYPGTPDEDYYFAGTDPYVVAPDQVAFLSAFTGLGLNGDGVTIYEFTTAIKALNATGLDQALTKDGPYTLFVPTDMAFANLPSGTLDKWISDPKTLAEVLKYHIVAGATTYDDLVAAGKVKTLQGDVLTITESKDDGLTFGINGASVANFPYIDQAGNTIWFINDHVLMPSK